MIQAETHVTVNKDAAAGVKQGVTDGIMDAAGAGFEVALAEVPHGATSGLARSGYAPSVEPDGSVTWGFSSRYAAAVERGSRPHWAPIEPLKKWARRVTSKGESFAYYVQWKIAQEGTPAQPFVAKGVDAMRAKLRARGLSHYISEVL